MKDVYEQCVENAVKGDEKTDVLECIEGVLVWHKIKDKVETCMKESWDDENPDPVLTENLILHYEMRDKMRARVHEYPSVLINGEFFRVNNKSF